MSQVLIISGHPNLSQSNTNTVIIDTVKSSEHDVEVRRLDTLYPDYRIDIEAEQQALLKADIVILQFPFYWYSVPALLKKWIDDVFAYDFAYGSKGDKLKGKDFILSFTVGGPKESYDPLGYNHFNIEQLILPLQQTAYLAGMNFVSPVYTNSMVYIPGVYNELEDVQARAREHASRLIEQLDKLKYSPQAIVEKFVKKWFYNFDHLPDNTTLFTEHLADDVALYMPEGEFKGHAGFLDWYAMVKATFKPNCKHTVEQLDVHERAGKLSINLRIRLDADTFPESAMKGEHINLLVNETWEATVSDSRHVTLHEYTVEPVGE